MKDYTARFTELVISSAQIGVKSQGGGWPDLVNQEQFHEWFSSSLNLLESVFGEGSTFSKRFREVPKENYADKGALETARGIFKGASAEYNAGYTKGIRREISEEFVVDLCLHAESLADEGHLESASVLTSAALEDCFKRRVEDQGIETDDKSLTDLSGASAKIVSGFPKFRNAAMHADWGKINEVEIRSITAFVKNFELNHTA